MKITVSTLVAAPIDKVWRAYSAPEDIQQWNAASADWHTTSATVDLRVGGTFSSRMEARDGSVGFDFAGTYTLVDPPHRLVYTFGDRSADVAFVPGASCFFLSGKAGDPFLFRDTCFWIFDSHNVGVGRSALCDPVLLLP